MAVPIWPLSLPQKPQKTGYERGITLNIEESQMDAGTKRRRKSVILPTPYKCSYVLTSEQAASLRNFIENILVQGVKAFDFPHPETGTLVRAQLKAGSEPKQVVWNNSLMWEITLTVEVYSYGNISG